MLKIGRYQDLRIKRFATVGAYLTSMDDDTEEVLLPKKYLDENCHEGMLIEAFVYRDSKDRIIATLEQPFATLGDLAVLKVKSVNQTGAFFDWGLEKDLFMPYREQSINVEEGKQYLVSIYLDKSERLCATMNVSKYLREDSRYEVGQWLTGTIYRMHEDFGAYVAVENCYSGRIPKKEIHEPLEIGQSVNVRITKIHDDGKLELSLREKSHLQRDHDSVSILDALDANEGYLPLSDNSDPEKVRELLKMSKKSFKKAIGKLFKEGVVIIEEQGIRRA